MEKIYNCQPTPACSSHLKSFYFDVLPGGAWTQVAQSRQQLWFLSEQVDEAFTNGGPVHRGNLRVQQRSSYGFIGNP